MVEAFLLKSNCNELLSKSTELQNILFPTFPTDSDLFGLNS